MSVNRRYLFVPPEDYAHVKAAGATWDDAKKSWYLAADQSPVPFSRWLGGDEDAAEFTLTSDEAFVASAQVSCVDCGERIEVVCLYCATGIDEEQGVLLTRLTVSNVWAMDAALAAQLTQWPNFRQVAAEEGAGEGFANHCPRCGAVQEDYGLHSEPGDVFFNLVPERAGTVEFTPLTGRVRLGGDVGFEVLD